MIKKLAVIGAFAVATTAQADINIGWGASGGFYLSDPNVGIIDPSGSFLAQLIYTASGAVGAVDPFALNFLGGDNTLLTSLTVSFPGNAGSVFGDFNAGSSVYAGALEGGFVFVRIFQDTTPDAGELYYDSPTLLTTQFTGIQAPQLAQANTDVINGNQLTLTIVPEPSVLAFLGLGGLALAARRRFSV
jgi:hypothetical protein